MKEWFGQFWIEHGNRIIWAVIANIIAMYLSAFHGMKEEANVVHIGTMMHCFNKMRGNGAPPKS